MENSEKIKKEPLVPKRNLSIYCCKRCYASFKYYEGSFAIKEFGRIMSQQRASIVTIARAVWLVLKDCKNDIDGKEISQRNYNIMKDFMKTVNAYDTRCYNGLSNYIEKTSLKSEYVEKFMHEVNGKEIKK